MKVCCKTQGFSWVYSDWTKIDIDDRIGGVVQILGQPNFPVILTSLGDDTVGQYTISLGFDVTDTNLNGGASEPRAGDWRSLNFCLS